MPRQTLTPLSLSLWQTPASLAAGHRLTIQSSDSALDVATLAELAKQQGYTAESQMATKSSFLAKMLSSILGDGGDGKVPKTQFGPILHRSQ